MINAVESLRLILLADSTVTALTSTRVYAHRLPEAQGTGIDATAQIAVIDDGSEQGVNAPVLTAGLTVECYAANEAAALALAGVVHGALHGRQNLTGGSVRWISCWVASTGEAQKAEETQWDFIPLQIAGLATSSS